tara:strand:- start:1902 stop:3008 length:1107 start_codon:yes stop_codon:yes gene_type:complete
MKILITGSNGFISKNLIFHLNETTNFEIFKFNKNNTFEELKVFFKKVDLIVHLAGENRSKNYEDFYKNNVYLTNFICNELIKADKKIPIIFSSSIHINKKNWYGETKKEAEEIILKLNKKNKNPVIIYRLPGVFGKWSKPNYNSVVATFCNNLANNLPINIDDKKAELNLIYIDDLVRDIKKSILTNLKGISYPIIKPEYKVSLLDIVKQINSFKISRETLIVENLGDSFQKKLYATYLSFLNNNSFSYPLKINEDKRGKFVEILKTNKSGQFSFFTAKPGVTRGGHYHHSKSEKFLVVKGEARFVFKDVISGFTKTINISGKNPEVVDTIPGWSHNITNIGNEDLIVFLWSNEIFDKLNPDTISFNM